MGNNETRQKTRKFAGIEVSPDLKKTNFFFLYFNTLIVGMLMTIPAIIQPAFLKDIIKVPPEFFGSINGFLQNMSQVATLALVAIVGALSDKAGRKILAVAGFVVLMVFYYLYGMSVEIGSALHIPAGFASKVCALLSFVPSQAANFAGIAPGLFVAYIIRFFIGIGLVLCYPQFITMVADYTYDKDRGKGMALNGLMMGLAALVIFGPVARMQKKSGVESLFFIASVIAATGVVCTWLFLKDRLPEIKKEKKGLKEVFGIVNKSITLKTTYWCSLIARADIVVLATFLVSWGVKVADKFHLTSNAATHKAAIPMIIMSVFSFIAFPVVGVLIDKWGRIPTIILALFSGGVGMILLAVSAAPFSGLVFVAVIFSGFGMAGAIAGSNTLATDASPKGMVGTILGGLNTMQPIGMLFFVAVGGYLFDKFGPGWAFGIKGIASIVLGAWVFTVRGRIKEESEETGSIDSLTFSMEWDDDAKKMLEKVPAPFRDAAVSGTEDYAKEHSHGKITPAVMDAFKKELGM